MCHGGADPDAVGGEADAAHVGNAGDCDHMRWAGAQLHPADDVYAACDDGRIVAVSMEKRAGLSKGFRPEVYSGRAAEVMTPSVRPAVATP